MKKIGSWLGAIALIFAVKVGFRLMRAEVFDSDDGQAEWIQEQDEWVSSEIGDGIASPARGWLSQGGHGTFEGDPARMDALIGEFESNGARVWMVGIEELGGRQISDSIAVELPTDAGSRSQVFAVEAAYWQGDGTPDVGQSYLVVSFD